MDCCSQCSRNPQEAIESRVEALGETFLREYVQVLYVMFKIVLTYRTFERTEKSY